jgi:hypothetical protein
LPYFRRHAEDRLPAVRKWYISGYRGWRPAKKEYEMTHLKLQAALDELDRLCDTVKGYKERNGKLPNADSDAGRALSALQSFTSELHKLNIGKVIDLKT